jgi:hypothetical protein
MDCGRLIRAARRTQRMSQRELAAIAGVPHSTIGRIERAASTRGSGQPFACFVYWGTRLSSPTRSAVFSNLWRRRTSPTIVRVGGYPPI